MMRSLVAWGDLSIGCCPCAVGCCACVRYAVCPHRGGAADGHRSPSCDTHTHTEQPLKGRPPQPGLPSTRFPPQTTLSTFGNFARALISRVAPHGSAPPPPSSPAQHTKSHPNFQAAPYFTPTPPLPCRVFPPALPCRSPARTYLKRCPSHRWRP